MKEYLSQLNDQQRAAVEYLDGPALVIAGAGSGKTRVLTYKIVHLLNNGFEPHRILALTFTNKAAREMRARIETLVGHHTASRLWMGTFHSIFSRILRNNADRLGFKRDFTIYDAADSKSLIKTIIKDMQLDDKIYKPATVMSAISTAKNALMSPEAYSAERELMEADKRARRPMTCAIYKAYKSRCFLAGAMDFDDLLYYTNVLLRDNPDILSHYREFFRYILVDEYQDTNFAQHLIVSQLCNNSDNLCVVGDDAQSIYSFRGANIRNILNLKKAYPNLRTFKLEQNYRSTQNIINAANSLIEKNKFQIPKRVFSKKEPGDRVEVVKSYSDYEESFLVANRISQIKIENGESYDEFAILYRTNAQSRILEESLRKRNIPYRIYGGLSFYQRKEIKDAISYFRLSVNPDDDEALRRIINTPGRGIGETTVNKLVRAAIDSGRSIWAVLNDLDSGDIQINSGTRKKLDSFRGLIQSFIDKNLSGANAEETAVKIIRDTRLLSSLITDRTPENISKQENIEELLNGVKEFVTSQNEQGLESETGISQYLAQISLLTDQDVSDSTEERVTLMTVHAAKGLEFSNVFIVGAEEDLFPSAMSSSSQSEIEEERRLMYVAITRAKHFCMISYATSRFRNGQTMTCQKSRFINDIDPHYLKVSAESAYGDRTAFNPIDRYRESFHTSQANPLTPKSSSGSYHSTNFARTQQATTQPPTGNNRYSIHTASELTPGMEIEHERFGRGRIEEIDTSAINAKITVIFSNIETKTLLLKFARFNIIS